MIVVMDLHVGEKELQAVENVLQQHGYRCHLIRGEQRIVILCSGAGRYKIPAFCPSYGQEVRQCLFTGFAAAVKESRCALPPTKRTRVSPH